MSSKPFENSPIDDSDHLHDVAANELTEDSDADEFDEEFSLDQLSQAYARVLKGADGSTDGSTGESSDDEDDESQQRSLSNRSVDEPAENESTEDSRSGADDNAACPITPQSIVESILFVGAPAGVKLTTKKIAALLRDISPKEVTAIVKELNARYTAENAAYRIKIVDGGLKYELDEALIPFQQEFFGRNKSVKLSQTAIDILAVVAYNQPIAREAIDKTRGKSSGSVLKQLVRRELIAMLPREKTSEPQRFVTTEKFLDFFQLAELEDLPHSHEVTELDELAD